MTNNLLKKEGVISVRIGKLILTIKTRKITPETPETTEDSRLQRIIESIRRDHDSWLKILKRK
jgi:hypothetical protein